MRRGSNPRATRIADAVASVPLEQKRIFSIEGTSAFTFSASTDSRGEGAPNEVPSAVASVMALTMSGWACPASSGPHEQTQSMSRLPSTSMRCAPSPRAIKSGVPPTALKARTGLLTPPGKWAFARACSAPLRSVFMAR